MKLIMRRNGVIVSFLCTLVCTAFLTAVPICLADDHRESVKHHHKHDGKRTGALAELFGKGHDKGNETTGQMVAWSFAAANLTIAVSILIRGLKKFALLGPELQGSLSKFNTIQKKHLMIFHYVFNPLILLLGILHWTLSRCESTALPELGLLIMGIIVVLGIALKLKLCPKTFLASLYKLHTRPLVLFLLVSLLWLGHITMD
jgi:hypothetical protein